MKVKELISELGKLNQEATVECLGIDRFNGVDRLNYIEDKTNQTVTSVTNHIFQIYPSDEIVYIRVIELVSVDN